MRGRLIGGQALFRLISRTYTDAPRRPNLILYTSDDCSLCVHFKKHLEYFLDKNNLDLKVDYRDIKQCDQLIFEHYFIQAISWNFRSIKMLAVHGGVGFNMPDDVAKWCAEALKLPEDEITQSVSFLEDHKFFNCGVGSNLTAQGTVECEAGYMTSKYFRFGAVGCVSTVKNPILAARAMALDTQSAPGLAKPQVLVGKGAEQWARERNLKICEPEDLITSTAQKEWREMTQNLVESGPLMLSTLTKMDTVGGVAVKDGHAEACVSSGGILYKRPGRLGQCTFFGSGVWTDKSGDALIAVSASGLGEALVRTDFCRSLARTVMNRNNQDLPAQVVEQWFQTEFLRSPYLTDIPPQMILAGGIVILQEAGCSELLVVHNTPSFPLAFKSRGKVKRVISKSSPQSPVKVDSYLL